MSKKFTMLLVLGSLATLISLVYKTISTEDGVIAITHFVDQFESMTNEVEKPSSPLENVEQFFYFNNQQEQLWTIIDPKINSNQLDINIYDPLTGDLIKTLQLEGFDWIGREMAKWQDTLWLLSPKTSAFAIINSNSLSVERDPKVINSMVPALPDVVFEVTRVNPNRIYLVLENSESYQINPTYKIAEQSHHSYNRAVAKFKSNNEYRFSLKGNERKKQITLLQKNDVIFEGQQYFHSRILYQNKDFALIQHRESLDKKSAQQLTHINNQGDTWTIDVPERDRYEALFTSNEKIVIGHQGAVNPIVFALNTQTGATLWTIK